MQAVQNVERLCIFMPFIAQAQKDIKSYKQAKHVPIRIHQAPFIIQYEKQRETILSALCALNSIGSGANLKARHPEFSKINEALLEEIDQFIKTVVGCNEWRLKFIDSDVRAKFFFAHKTIQVMEMGPLQMEKLYKEYEAQMPELIGHIELLQRHLI
ncbi:hypothetical protein CAEBREN_25178 [Caenorhabditis brenneri]|uniref:Uncharacterized protein n=1 Tax=Caenorhabditis brenneri TaxID=135651 RepID=G0P618_CAEBE|nr:hypothetical protein CAEBREN_25178 [Caenorhabditis brenneri]